MCNGHLDQLFLKVFFKKNQADIFKNKLRTPILIFGGLLLHKPLGGKSQNEMCYGHLDQLF